jgi:peptidoglycan/LPS O-acetylase OafA/YrhL
MFGIFRCLLALMVVVQHLGGAHTLGSYAVFGFYILSGYLMTSIMHKQYGYSAKGMGRYAINRFLRIYPMYFLSIAITLVLLFVWGNSSLTAFHDCVYLPQTATEILRNIFMVFSVTDCPRLTPPSWALAVEVCFYILIGLGLSKFKSLVIVWFSLSALYHLVAMFIGLDWSYRYFTVLAASLPFATGALIFHAKKPIDTYVARLSANFIFIVLLALGALILLNWYVGALLNQVKGISFYINFLLAAVVIMVLAGVKTSNLRLAAWDKWWGALSYPMYLMHFQVGFLTMIIANNLGLSVKRSESLLVFCAMPVLLAVALLFVRFIEQPIENYRAKVRQSGDFGAVVHEGKKVIRTNPP